MGSICLLLLMIWTAASAQDAAHLRRLAETGNAKAQNALGVAYRMGNGVPRDYTESLKWFMASAKQGYSSAFYNIATAYFNGDGVPVDPPRAYAWFTLAREMGDTQAASALQRMAEDLQPFEIAEAELILGELYQQGEIVREPGKIVYWYEQAAKHGAKGAAERLARIYDEGKYASRNDALAFYWTSEAAKSGEPETLFRLAEKYQSGQGTAADPKKAVKFYEQSVELGYGPAANNLGVLYAASTPGLKVDQIKSCMWFLIGSGLGVSNSKIGVERVCAALSPAESRKFHKDAQKWWKQHLRASLPPALASP